MQRSDASTQVTDTGYIGGPLSSPQNVNSKFPFTYAMFGLMMLVVFVGRAVSHSISLILIVALYVLMYAVVESQVKDVMSKMENSSSYFRRTPYFLIPYAVLLLAAAVGGFYLLDFRKNSVDFSLFSTYMRSLLESIVIFMFGSSLKCLLLGTGLVGLRITRRGFFGVFQRVFIIIRNIVLAPLWLGFFCEVPPTNFEAMYNAKKSFWCLSYMVMKCFLQLWLLGDLGAVIRDYSFNRRATYRPVNDTDIEDECIICQDKPEEPVALECGHIFCYKCAYRWLKDHNSCPFCRAQIMEPKVIEFSDGFIPFSTILCTF